MKRRLFNLATGVSLIVTVVAVVELVRSQFRSDTLSYGTVTWSPDESGVLVVRYFGSYWGSIGVSRLTIRYVRQPLGSRDAASLGWRYESQVQSQKGLAFNRFEWHTYNPGGVDTIERLSLPWWCVAVAGSLLPAWAGLRTYRIRRRSKLSCCLTCGRDLRATPDRCPECGMEPKPQPAEGAAA
jgi:hypothetical protein